MLIAFTRNAFILQLLAGAAPAAFVLPFLRHGNARQAGYLDRELLGNEGKGIWLSTNLVSQNRPLLQVDRHRSHTPSSMPCRGRDAYKQRLPVATE